MPSSLLGTAFMRASIRPNSPPSESWFRWQPPRQSVHEGTESLASSDTAQRASAPGAVLGDPALHSLRISDQSLDNRGRRMAASASPGGAQLHSRLLARPLTYDPDGVAATRADAYADFGAPRRPHHCRCGDLFRHRFDRRLDTAR